MSRKKEYTNPQVAVVALDYNTMLAASNLKYTEEEADENLEVLTKKGWQSPTPWE